MEQSIIQEPCPTLPVLRDPAEEFLLSQEMMVTAQEDFVSEVIVEVPSPSGLRGIQGELHSERVSRNPNPIPLYWRFCCPQDVGLGKRVQQE